MSRYSPFIIKHLVIMNMTKLYPSLKSQSWTWSYWIRSWFLLDVCQQPIGLGPERVEIVLPVTLNHSLITRNSSSIYSYLHAVKHDLCLPVSALSHQRSCTLLAWFENSRGPTLTYPIHNHLPIAIRPLGDATSVFRSLWKPLWCSVNQCLGGLGRFS